MYIDMRKYNKMDIQDEAKKCFIEGYETAIEDLKSARDNYLDNNEIEIKAFQELQEQITEDYNGYALQYLKDQRDMELVAILENQDLLDDEASEKG